MLPLRKSNLAAILALAVVALGSLSLIQYVTIERMNLRQPFLSSDQVAIQKAIETFQLETHADRNSVIKGRFPIVIRFGGVRCVALQVPRDHLGKTPVYCFDMNYHRVSEIRADAAPVVDAR